MVIGRYQIPTLKSSYGDSLDPQKLSFMGSQAINAITPGGYATEDGKFTVSESVFRGILGPLLATNGFGNDITQVGFSYSHPIMGSDSDLLSQCRITGTNGSQESGGKPNEREFKITYAQIYWTDRRITINDLGDVPQSLGLSRLAF
jgi:hypothetical protein